MRLDLSEDQAFFQETVRRFVESETPISTIRDWHDLPLGYEPRWWQQASELGWTSLLVPEADGGGSMSGAPLVDLSIVAEECGRGLAPAPLLPNNVVAGAIGRMGSDAQRTLLTGIASTEVGAAWAFAEPDGRATADSLTFTAESSGSGFVLNGTKAAVEAGNAADVLLVTARTPSGLAQFLIPRESPGLVIAAQQSLDVGKRFAQLDFAEVEVGAEALLGVVGEIDDEVETQLLGALIIQAAETMGAAARVLEFTIEYAFNRYSFGRPLASYQELKHRFADMKLWLEAGHAAVDGAADAMYVGGDASRVVRAAASYVGDRSVELIQDCVQIHGGIGVTYEHDIHLYLRRATVNRGLLGSPASLRNDVAVGLGV